MKVSHSPALSQSFKCPYLPERTAQYLIFNTLEISPTEVDILLAQGFRRFGEQVFRPECLSCRECIPLRVPLDNFTLSRSQKRIIKRNQDILVRLGPLTYRPDHYQLYLAHQERFKDKEGSLSEAEFIHTHYSVHQKLSWASEFFLDGELIAFGLLEKGKISLSSQYFVFGPKHAKRSLGTFSALEEIRWAKEQQLKYYYLGYWIKDNHSMSYKNQFGPHEIFNQQNNQWTLV